MLLYPASPGVVLTPARHIGGGAQEAGCANTNQLTRAKGLKK